MNDQPFLHIPPYPPIAISHLLPIDLDSDDLQQHIEAPLSVLAGPESKNMR